MKDENTVFADLLKSRLHQHSEGNGHAIIWENEQGEVQHISYAALYEKSLIYAASLQSYCSSIGKGEHGEVRVGICLPRENDFVISFLAVWIAGAVFVPISDASLARLQENPEYKQDFEKRVRALTPHLDLIITDSSRMSLLQALSSLPLVTPADLVQSQAPPLRAVTRNLFSEAFIYCSSGTTGPPKIITLPYEGILDRVNSVIETLDFTAQDCFLNYTGYDFDPSLMEIIVSFLLGTSLVVAPEYARLNPQNLSSFFEKLTRKNFLLPNVAIIVPSMLKLILPNTFPQFKALMTTGENILPKDLEPWFAQHPKLRIFTGYGPTETTWGATLTEISRDPIFIHITKPMRGIDIKLIPAVDGDTHEILIGGNGMGHYIGEKAVEYSQKNFLDIDAKRYFLPHDAVRIETGNLIYSSRIDDLIKYHGKWISLDEIDAIAESFPGVQHATTVSISATSLVFIFLVLRADCLVNFADLEHDFRRKCGAELYPTFFEVATLKFNARGKRCRHLKDYPESRPLTLPHAAADPLSLIWTQALAEIEIHEVEKAYSVVGIRNYQQYLPLYSATDRFDDLGGRSIKLPRLVNLLWDAYISDPHRSQQIFKAGLLRYQAFQDMGQFIQIYQLAKAAFSRNEFQPSESYLSLTLSLPAVCPEIWEPECCELVEAEMKASFPAPFYHLILQETSASMFAKIKTRLSACAVVDDARQISLPSTVEKYYAQQLIKTLLSKSPQVTSAHRSLLTVAFTQRLILLGTACGKTSFLLQQHEQLIRAGKIACYFSCRDLLDEVNNLPKFLGLTHPDWETLCIGDGILSEIIWLVDDVECGILDNRLNQLENCLLQYRGKSGVIYAARENFYPYLLLTPDRYGQVQFLQPHADVNLYEWFQAEVNRSGQSSAIFFKQLKFLFEELKRRRYIRAECRNDWWEHTTPEKIQAHIDLPPLYLTQYPCFSSLVRFLVLHDTSVYSIRPEFAVDLEDCLSSILSQDSAKTRSSAYVPMTSRHSAQLLPTHIQYFPGESYLSPWICFHSISGNCPEGYAVYAETIFAETHQGTFTISMPERYSWESLSAQVASYLEEIERYQLVPRGAPYYLLGWSYGGYLAVEAARQLEKQGKTVAVVVNLDAAPLFAYAHFQWETHEQYVRSHIMKYNNASRLLKGMQCNVGLLQQYCQAQEAQVPLLAKNYIFEVAQQPETLSGVVYGAWRQQTPLCEFFHCKSDHFGIFSDAVLQTQFLKILKIHREQADPRPLKNRLQEKAQRILDSQRQISLGSPEYIAPELEEKIHREFLEHEEAANYLIIEGEAGVGKSRLLQHLVETLLNGRNSGNWLPLIFPLRYFLGTRDASTLLTLYGLSASDLRQPIRFLFIIDAFDEGELDLDEYPLRLDEYGHQSKVIITVRKGIHVHIFQPTLRWELPILDPVKLDQWLKYFGEEHQILSHMLSADKTELNWMRTPLHLSMLLRLQRSGKKIIALIKNIYLLYQSLDELLFRENSSLLNLGNEKVAYRRYRESLVLQENLSGNGLWNYPDLTTQAFRKASQLIEQNGALIFSHITWKQFHLAATLLESAQDLKPINTSEKIPCIYTRAQIIKLPATGFLIQLLINFWGSADSAAKFKIRRNLFSIILLSRRFKDSELVKRAACTAIEILNIFQVSVAGLDFSGTQMPGCDLSGAILQKSRFRNSDLSSANLTCANMKTADFTGSKLVNIESGGHLLLKGNLFCYSVDGRFFASCDNDMLQIRDTSDYHILLEYQVSEGPIKLMVFSRQNAFACSTASATIIFKNVDRGVSTPVQLDFPYEVHAAAFSPQGDELALLFKDGVSVHQVSLLDTGVWLSAEENLSGSNSRARQPKNMSAKLEFSSSGSDVAALLNDRFYIWKIASRTLIKLPELKSSPTDFLYHPTRPLLFVLGQSRISRVDTTAYKGIDLVYVVKTKGRYPPVAHYTKQKFHLNLSREILICCTDIINLFSALGNDPRAVPVNNALGSYPETVRVAPNGRQLAALFAQNISIVDLNSGNIERKLDTNNSYFQNLAFHPQGTHCAALTKDSHIHIWPMSSKISLQQFLGRGLENRAGDHKIIGLKSRFILENAPNWVSFYPHNRSLETFGNGWRPLLFYAIRSDEKQMVCGIFQKGVFLIEDDNTSRQLMIDTHQHITSIAYLAPDETKLAVLVKSQIYIVDTLTGLPENIISDLFHEETSQSMTVSPDGKMMLVRSLSSLVIFELGSPDHRHHLPLISSKTQQREVFKHHPRKNQCIGIEGADLIVLNYTDFPLEFIRLCHENKVTDFMFHPYLDALISITEMKQIYFWDLTVCKLIEKQETLCHFNRLSFTPQNKYFAIWYNQERYQRHKNSEHLIQLWDAETRRCLHQFSFPEPVQDIVWLNSATQNRKGQLSYYFSFYEFTYRINNVYEVTLKKDARLTVSLIWSSSRQSSVNDQAISSRAEAIGPVSEANRETHPISNTPMLDIIFKISDYLSYRDYCSLLCAYQISALKCLEYQKRPLIESEDWKLYSPGIGEQLQRMGFFRLRRAADIHHLTLQHVAESAPEESDSYRSVIIREENGEICGDVDVFLLHDSIQMAKRFYKA